MTAGQSLFLLIGFALLLGLYFTPSVIAFTKLRKNKIAILALNGLAGWTFIGWIISLVWALAED